MNIFDDLVSRWDDEFARDTLSPTTYAAHRNRIASKILPYFQKLSIEKITKDHIETFLAGLTTRDGSPASQNTKIDHYKSLQSLFKFASEQNLVT